MKEKSEKVGLKLNIQKTKIKTSSPITSWQIDGETIDWYQIRKGINQGCILSPCLFNLYAEYIMWNARVDEAQAGIKIAGRNINNLTLQMTPPYGKKVKRNWRAS